MVTLGTTASMIGLDLSKNTKNKNKIKGIKMEIDKEIVQKVHRNGFYITEEVIAIKFLNKIKTSKQRGINFELTIPQFRRLMLLKTCHYSGIELYKGKPRDEENPSFNSMTIDRIDNTIGYTKDNSVVAAYGVNQLKGELERNNNGVSLKHLIKMVKVLAKYMD